MRLQGFAVVSLLLAGCASFEPRVSVETHETRPTSGNSRTPASTRNAQANTPSDYTVVRGDTLYGIAFRNKLDFRDLAAWNNINAPYTIYPGQGLRLTPPSRTTRVTTTASAPVADVPAQPVATTAPAASPSQQVEVAAVPMQPAMTPETSASDSGNTQTFAVADDSASAAVAAPAPPVDAKPVQTGPVATNSPAAAIGLAPSTPKPPEPAVEPSASVPVAAVPAAVAATPVVAATTTAAVVDPTPLAVVDPNAPTRSRDGLRWRWPVAGRVIGRFVEGDPTQQGIDVGGALGQHVLAAADGEVVYSGNGLLGYGELVIVQHSPGFLSAYGHNQKRLVLEGSKVKAGQPIAEMGRRGGIDMLHFEIRRNGKPVDPLGYLPSR